ncbi:hypothetical protein E1A91_D02G225400v1 [Gossypium mustelinum]|uniref:Uncharacterized protein n=2 Tax=Gossypium TaxID=3633 RepID=A0A5D2VZI3_GOSMU|nr:hypothetical protein ES288_D02G236400v1 [Gossypium darwinii]TYI94728.1 hypothetical protein E1A91_D02G225400v1 [Gossypium mustelinum]
MSVFSPWDLPLPYASNHSNLQCFLRCITPVVPTRLLPKKCNEDSNCGNLETNEKERDEEGYSLSEVWESYSEWSAYGVDVPIVLNNGDCVVQYYSPSLSAMQIYTFKPSSSSFRGLGNMVKPENVSCCNDDDDDDDDGGGRSEIYNSSASSNDSCLSSEAAWDEDSTQTNTMDQCGYLYYQYNEMASPYDRVPLQVKMNELGKHYPGLFDLRSTEISPYSWMAIAWYPVYQIPMATNVKELSACFLTYHPLSGSRTGSNKEEISLPPFAVVTYKLFGTLWINPETSDKDTIICQQTAACNWLRQLQFQHHDFNFFMSRQFQNP